MKFRQQPWSHDHRSKRFTTKALQFAAIPQLPISLFRIRYECLDQGDSTRCAAYAAVINGQYIHGQTFSIDWQVNKISRIQGYSVDGTGSDPNAAMNSQTYSKEGGYLPSNMWTLTAPALLDRYAQDYSTRAFVKPASGKDVFDSICVELFRAYHEQRGACVQMFTGWYDNFSQPEIRTIGNLLGYHSYLAIDFNRQDQNEDNHYLVLQNSYGRNMGENGYHKMYRPVVNKLLSGWGSSCKIPVELTKAQLELAKQETPLGKIQRQLINAFYTVGVYLVRLYGKIAV